MATFQNQRFSNEEIVVDGNRYAGCVFTDSTLVYSGGALPVFANCTFRQTKIQLAGAARSTTQYLCRLYDAGLSGAVDKVLAGLENGTLLRPHPVTPPTVYLGHHYGQLARYGAILILIAALLGAALWYSYHFYPESVVLVSEPAKPLYPIAVLQLRPVLTLKPANCYDQFNTEALTQFAHHAEVAQTVGMVKLSINETFSILLYGTPTFRAEGQV